MLKVVPKPTSDINERPVVDPINRTIFLHEYSNWPGDPLAVLASLERHNLNPDVRSGLCLALGTLDGSTLDSAIVGRVTERLRRLHKDARDTATHSACDYALRKWRQEVPAGNELPTGFREGYDWCIEPTLGLTMLKVPAGRVLDGF